MAKNQYVGVNNVARKVKQPYIGVNNVARKVKSGYVGVNGVARQYYESVVYHTWKRYNFTNITFTHINFNFRYNGYHFHKKFSWASNYSPMTTIFSVGNNAYLGNHGYIDNPLTLKADYTLSFASIGDINTMSTSYLRHSDNTYHDDKYIMPNDNYILNNTNYGGLEYIFIPGWRFAGDAHYYDINSVREYPLYYPDISYCTAISREDDGDDMTWIGINESNNYIGEITAPAGTYPDCGLSGGIFYIKQ